MDFNPLFGRQSCSKHEEKKARRQVTADGMDDDEPYVEVVVPGVEWEGKSLPGRTLKVIRPAKYRDNLKVEFTTDNLDYMRLACLKTAVAKEKRRHKPDVQGQYKLCRWIEKRKGFLAQRTDNCKFFKAKDNIDEARDLAIHWAKGGDVPDCDGGGECMGVSVEDAHGVHVRDGSMSPVRASDKEESIPGDAAGSDSGLPPAASDAGSTEKSLTRVMTRLIDL